MSFFKKSELMVVRAPSVRVPQCGACGLYRGCKSPKMPVAGEGQKKILIIGEAPGETEDNKGKPFIGPAGERLQFTLRYNSVEMFRDCWVTNAARCRPPRNQLPDKAVDYCRPYVLNEIRDLKPEVIILLGGHAVSSVIGHVWKVSSEHSAKRKGVVGKWTGWRIPLQRWNCWICPTWHPSYVERELGNGNQVPKIMFEEHISKACELTGRPWEVVPDFAKDVDVVMDTHEAARKIEAIHERVRSTEAPIAFDYENDRLKPEHPEGRIVCCSVSDGSTTVSYPWHGEAVRATRELLIDHSVKKIASNLKHEAKWTYRDFGFWVRGWDPDTMLLGHALDARTGITGLKFQAFVRLGQEDYDHHIHPFLASSDGGGNTPNRIREVSLPNLLLYCGLDSLLEWKVAEHQKKEMGI